MKAFFAVCVGTFVCAAFSACNDSGSVAKSALGSSPIPVTPPAPSSGPTGTEPARIETFAQSLEGFTFKFNRGSRKVSVSFTRVAPEASDSSGRPTLEAVRDFEGELPRGTLSAVLVQGGVDRSVYGVRVECTDDTCHSASIQIDRFSGRLAGRAVLQFEEREINASLNRNMPSGRLTTSHDPLTSALAELTSRDNLSAIITSSVIRVEEGRHTWFETRYDFLPQPLMRLDQPGYFDDKTLLVSGEIAPHALLKVMRSTSLRGTTVATAASVYGKVKFRESPFAIAVSFERSDLRDPSTTVSESMTAPLSW
jgi:hypothetical protein